MDKERLLEKISKAMNCLKDAMEELGDYSVESNSLEDDYGDEVGGSKENTKQGKIAKLLDALEKD